MKIKQFNRGPGLFLIFYQIILLAALPFYFYYTLPSWGIISASIALLYLTGLSITGGYHRYYSHRTFKTNQFLETILLFFGSMAGQGSALRWSFDHRLHHAHVDTDNDPYSIKKGFWYAHCLWILEKPRTIDPKVVSDLMRNKLVMFQHRHFKLCMTVTNLMAFLLVGWMCNDYLSAFVISLWVRLFILHHFTWFINSLAHTWGDKPFCKEQTAVDNFLIAFLTFGEGYHNYHHTFANDYRNGIRWFHYDPTKWLIWSCYKLGLVTGLKKMDPITVKKKMVLERKDLLINQIKNVWYVQKDALETVIQDLSNNLVNEINQIYQLIDQYHALRKQCSEKETLKEIRLQIKSIKKSLKKDWNEWVRLSRSIMKLKPLEIPSSIPM